jgi:uncharacterized OsmC-like protein
MTAQQSVQSAVHPSTPNAAQLNGVDTAALQGLIANIAADPAQGQTRWDVTTQWQGGCKSRTHIKQFELGARKVQRDFAIVIDEPREIGGTDTAPNPQDFLLAALNGCMTVGYVACATLMGIRLESLEIRTAGNIDLRGVLGMDASVTPGYESLHYTVKIKGDATPQQFQELHAMVAATSANRWNLSQPIKMTSDLIVQ